MKRMMMAALTTLTLTACGSFPLGTSYPQQGQTRAETEQNILFCKDKARTEVDTTGRQIGSFLAGMTIIGAPIAIADERRAQREIFAACMTERGYKVEPPA